jgi:FAD/FMN-containing dehydrogenase
MRRRQALQGLAATAALASCKQGCRPTTQADVGGVVVDDVSRLNATRVRRVVACHDATDVSAAVVAAGKDGFPVIASGRRHSQGGQCSVDDGVVLDLTPMKKIVGVDAAARTVTVEAGAAWDDVQRALNPHGLAVRTMQSSNIFTVGGSLASNVHGRDVDAGAIFSDVEALTVVGADGVARVLPRGDARLPFVVGGYGLFGVVVEATLRVTENRLLRHDARVVKAADVAALFDAEVKGTGALFVARASVAPSSFLDEAVVETWSATADVVDDAAAVLGEEVDVARDALILDAARASAAGKESRWILQREAALTAPRRITRNNAMRPPTTPLQLRAHDVEADTDVVQ